MTNFLVLMAIVAVATRSITLKLRASALSAAPVPAQADGYLKVR